MATADAETSETSETIQNKRRTIYLKPPPFHRRHSTASSASVKPTFSQSQSKSMIPLTRNLQEEVEEEEEEEGGRWRWVGHRLTSLHKQSPGEMKRTPGPIVRRRLTGKMEGEGERGGEEPMLQCSTVANFHCIKDQISFLAGQIQNIAHSTVAIGRILAVSAVLHPPPPPTPHPPNSIYPLNGAIIYLTFYTLIHTDTLTRGSWVVPFTTHLIILLP